MIEKAHLLNTLENALSRFPNTLDTRLIEGFERIVVNAPKNFIPNRSSTHLLLLLITQFFLQSKIELAVKKEKYPFFLRLFQKKSHLCLMITLPTHESEYAMEKGSLFKTVQQFIPGIQEVEGSYFKWFHPELPYVCLYLEMQKLRGKELSSKEVRSLEQTLKNQLSHFIPVQTPALFWPLNEEEAYKQIQVLQKELQHAHDLPQVMIYFREQSKYKLEFLVSFARPQSDIFIDQVAEQLPSSVSFFYHFLQTINHSFPLEAGCFSLIIPSHTFYENNAINLLCARRYVAKYVEQLVGPFRDFNGGLLEKQQEKFESL